MARRFAPVDTFELDWGYKSALAIENLMEHSPARRPSVAAADKMADNSARARKIAMGRNREHKRAAAAADKPIVAVDDSARAD
jgi:hypothetical protein